MRRLVLIASAVVATAGLVFGAVVWVQRHHARVTLAQRVDHALELAQTESGMSDALNELEAVLKLDDEQVDALVAAGRIEMQFKHFAKARAQLQRAADLSSGSDRARVLVDLGNAAREMYRGGGSDDDFRAARDAFLEARGDAATEAAALDAYGFLLMEDGRFRDREMALKAYVELQQKHTDFEPDRIAAVIDLLEKLTGKKDDKSASGG